MECARRDMDRLRHSSSAGARHRFDPRRATEYLPLWPGWALASASGSRPIRAVGKFAANQLYPRLGELRISQAFYRLIQHRRSAVQLRVLDQSTPRLLSLVG